MLVACAKLSAKVPSVKRAGLIPEPVVHQSRLEIGHMNYGIGFRRLGGKQSVIRLGEAYGGKYHRTRHKQWERNVFHRFHGGQMALGSKLRMDTLAAFGTWGRRKGFSQALWQA